MEGLLLEQGGRQSVRARQQFQTNKSAVSVEGSFSFRWFIKDQSIWNGVSSQEERAVSYYFKPQPITIRDVL